MSMVRTSSPVLVGRAAELRTLVAMATWPGSVTFVAGEAGIGKTRLVCELLAQGEVAARHPLVGHCQPLREPFPYGAVIEALRELDDGRLDAGALSALSGTLRPYLPELAHLLPTEPAPVGDPRVDRHRLFRAVRELLAAAGPAVLVIEDLHWADDGSRQLLRFLMADPPANLSFVVTFRGEEVPGGVLLDAAYRPAANQVSATVELQPLDIAEVRVMTAAILGEDEVSAEFAARLHERTAGVPFVVEETLHALRNPQGAVHSDGVTARRLLETAEVPALLREAMAERLARLPLAARRATDAAAVIGVPATAALVGAIAGLPPKRAGAALTQALHATVLRESEDGTYGFRHALAQQAVYRNLTGPERERLHLRVVDALRTVEPPPLVQLAEHSRLARARRDWLHYGERAADQAAAVGDAETATGLLQALLTDDDLSASDVDRLAHKLSLVSSHGLAQDEVLAALERLLTDHRLAPAVRGEVRLTLGRLLMRKEGGFEAARMELELAIKDLHDRPELQGVAMSVLAQPFVGTTPVAENLRWLEEVEATAARMSDHCSSTNLLANSIGSRLVIGEAEAWRSIGRLPESPVTAEEQRYLARGHCNLADACSWIGYYERAHQYLSSGMRLATDSGAPYIASIARSTQAHVDWATGAWEGLESRATRLLDEYRDLHAVATELSLVLGCLAAARGAWDRAAEHFANTGINDPANGTAPVVMAAHAGVIRMRLDQEDAGGAVAEAERALAVVRRKGVWVWACELAPAVVDAYCMVDRVGDAATVTEEFAAGIDGRDAPAARAALAFCRGLLAAHLGDYTRAHDHLERANTAFAELPAPYYATLAAERQARCRSESDHDIDADSLTAIVMAYDSLGATRDAARCRHLLRANGAGQSSRRGRRGYGDELSPRERDVARLLADGRTNREIAEVLFLSRRTVEQHVANVLRKMKLPSREALRGRWDADPLGALPAAAAHR